MSDSLIPKHPTGPGMVENSRVNSSASSPSPRPCGWTRPVRVDSSQSHPGGTIHPNLGWSNGGEAEGVVRRHVVGSSEVKEGCHKNVLALLYVWQLKVFLSFLKLAL